MNIPKIVHTTGKPYEGHTDDNPFLSLVKLWVDAGLYFRLVEIGEHSLSFMTYKSGWSLVLLVQGSHGENMFKYYIFIVTQLDNYGFEGLQMK